MANHKSAEKQHRQSLRRRDRNRHNRSRLRTSIKRFEQALSSGELDSARKMLPDTLSLVDRSAKLGSIATNAADRTKSRLTRALNRASVA